MRLIVSGRKAVTAIVSVCLAFSILIAALWVRTAAVVSGGIAVPILMYHSVGYNDRVNSPYFLSPEAFEEDMRWLSDGGYTAVFVSDLVHYVLHRTALPEKPVVITLDDGFLNTRTHVLPILEKYGMKAVVNVVGSFCETYSQHPDPDPAYAYLTWEDVRALGTSGCFEIGNHTYGMHSVGERKGCMKLAGETAEAYAATLSNDLNRLQSALTQRSGVTPAVFAYPYGAVSTEAVFVLQSLGFSAALTCVEKVNYLSADRPEDLFSLGRFNRPSGVATEVFMKGVFGKD